MFNNRTKDEKMREMFVTHFFVLLVPFISTLDIEAEKSKACKEKVIVTAMVENMDDNTTAYLFSGQNVWTMVIENHTLLRVDIIGDIFIDVTGPIESGSKHPFERIYYLVNAKQGFKLVLVDNTTYALPYEAYMDLFKVVFSFHQTPPLMGCSASYKVGPTTSEQTFIGIDGSLYHCSCNCEQFKSRSCSACRKTTRVINPNGVESAELKNCQGLIIDDGLNPFEEIDCGSRRKRGTDVKSRYRMLFADKRKIRYWEGDKLKYSEDLKKVFGCKSSFILYAVGAFVIGFVVVTTVVSVVILLYVSKTKRREITEETRTTQTVNTTSDITYLVQTTQSGSGTKSLKSKAVFKI